MYSGRCKRNALAEGREGCTAKGMPSTLHSTRTFHCTMHNCPLFRIFYFHFIHETFGRKRSLRRRCSTVKGIPSTVQKRRTFDSTSNFHEVLDLEDFFKISPCISYGEFYSKTLWEIRFSLMHQIYTDITVNSGFSCVQEWRNRPF